MKLISIMLPLEVSRRGNLPSVGLHIVDGLDNEVDLLMSALFAGSSFDDDLVSSGVHTAVNDRESRSNNVPYYTIGTGYS